MDEAVEAIIGRARAHIRREHPDDESHGKNDRDAGRDSCKADERS